MSDSQESDFSESSGVNEHLGDTEDSGGDSGEYDEWSDGDDVDGKSEESDEQSESDSDHNHSSSSDSDTDVEIVINDKNTIAVLSGDLDSNSLLSRYTRCDAITPTLSLSSCSVKFAVDVFNKGELKKDLWTDIVRKYLTVAESQHELLEANIQPEYWA